MRILFCGDIVGRPGRETLRVLLPGLRERFQLDFILANAENAAGGSGITPETVRELFSSGIDILTSGDHIWRKKDVFKIIDREPTLLRPANFKDFLPGKGFCLKEKKGLKLGVINLVGRVFMPNRGDCPFLKARTLMEKISSLTPNIIVDMHAEATSEKLAMGYFLGGKASAVIGTHTHIPTADERIIDGHTAYITDIGMTGSFDSILGRKKEKVVEHFLTDLPQRFDVADSDLRLQGVLIEIDKDSGRAISIERIEERFKKDK